MKLEDSASYWNGKYCNFSVIFFRLSIVFFSSSVRSAVRLMRVCHAPRNVFLFFTWLFLVPFCTARVCATRYFTTILTEWLSFVVFCFDVVVVACVLIVCGVDNNLQHVFRFSCNFFSSFHSFHRIEIHLSSINRMRCTTIPQICDIEMDVKRKM